MWGTVSDSDRWWKTQTCHGHHSLSLYREEQHRLSDKYLLLPFTEEKNVIQVWNDTKMIKLWQSIHFSRKILDSFLDLIPNIIVNLVKCFNLHFSTVVNLNYRTIFKWYYVNIHIILTNVVSRYQYWPYKKNYNNNSLTILDPIDFHCMDAETFFKISPFVFYIRKSHSFGTTWGWNSGITFGLSGP